MRFLLWLVLLSVPIYTVPLLVIAGRLPVAFAFAIVPLAVTAPLAGATATVWHEGGIKGLAAMFRGAMQPAHWSWSITSTVVIPALLLLTGGLLLLAGTPVPQSGPWVATPLFFLVFLLAGAAEELGWMGVVYPDWRGRFGRFGAAAALGLVWSVWHLPFWGATFGSALEVAAQTITAVALRFLLVALYERSGDNVQVTILAHASYNTAIAVVPVYDMAGWLGIFLLGVLSAASALVLWPRLEQDEVRNLGSETNGY